MKHKYNLKTLKHRKHRILMMEGENGGEGEMQEAKKRINKRGRNKQIEIRET